jgi:hypothetical protein
VNWPCPDCDHDGFLAALELAYGPPIEVGGVKFYSDPMVHERRLVDPASFVRAACPKHGRATEQAKDDV